MELVICILSIVIGVLFIIIYGQFMTHEKMYSELENTNKFLRQTIEAKTITISHLEKQTGLWEERVNIINKGSEYKDLLVSELKKQITIYKNIKENQDIIIQKYKDAQQQK